MSSWTVNGFDVYVISMHFIFIERNVVLQIAEDFCLPEVAAATESSEQPSGGDNAPMSPASFTTSTTPPEQQLSQLVVVSSSQQLITSSFPPPPSLSPSISQVKAEEEFKGVSMEQYEMMKQQLEASQVTIRQLQQDNLNMKEELEQIRNTVSLFRKYFFRKYFSYDLKTI